MATTLTLTGLLGKTDSRQRLHLYLVDVLPSREKSQSNDPSWARLKAAVPRDGRYAVPYSASGEGSGVRGECWVTTPSRGGAAVQDRRRRILAFAEELRGKEVVLTVRPRRYSCTNTAGTQLQLVSIEAHG